MDFLLNSEQFVQLVCRQHVQVGNVVPCLIGALEPFVVFFLEEEALPPQVVLQMAEFQVDRTVQGFSVFVLLGQYLLYHRFVFPDQVTADVFEDGQDVLHLCFQEDWHQVDR